MLKTIKKWFDLKLGWFFTNGYKQEKHKKWLKSKYEK